MGEEVAMMQVRRVKGVVATVVESFLVVTQLGNTMAPRDLLALWDAWDFECLFGLSDRLRSCFLFVCLRNNDVSVSDLTRGQRWLNWG